MLIYSKVDPEPPN